MALLPDQKFSTFQNGGDLAIGDTLVGLRGGLNTKFTYSGLPDGLVVPITKGGTGATTAAGARSNLGLGTVATQDANAVNFTGGTLNGVAITASTAALTSGTISAAPASANDLVNKAYVDAIAFNVHPAANFATTTNFASTYNNGASGVGATLTATSNGAFSTDGQSPALNDRILVKDQTNPPENGIYTLTQVGDGSTPAILTRATDFDTSDDIQAGDTVAVVGGNTLAGSKWMMTQTATIVVGTTDITWIDIAVPENVMTLDGTQTATGAKTFNDLTLGGDMDADSNKIVNLTDPTDPQDAATKAYVDSAAATTQTIQVFQTSGTWTKPAGCTKALVYTTGGGGGGGAAVTTANSSGGGGGAGATAIRLIDVTGTASEAVTVGAGGAGGVTGGAGAGTGGTSSFGAFCSATGGAGGATASSRRGGAGGTASGGDINADGGGGGGGELTSSATSGQGGSSFWGGGGYSVVAPSAGIAATCFGAGGSGGSNNSAAASGGAGKSGIVVVYEYY